MSEITGNKGTNNYQLIDVLLTLKDKIMKDLNVCEICRIVEKRSDKEYLVTPLNDSNQKLYAYNLFNLNLEKENIVLVIFTNTDNRINLSKVDNNISTQNTNGKDLHSLEFGIILKNSVDSGDNTRDVKVNGTSVVSDGIANLYTKGAYNKDTNKLATESDLPDLSSYLTDVSYDSSSKKLKQTKNGTTISDITTIPRDVTLSVESGSSVTGYGVQITSGSYLPSAGTYLITGRGSTGNGTWYKIEIDGEEAMAYQNVNMGYGSSRLFIATIVQVSGQAQVTHNLSGCWWKKINIS